MRPRRSQPLVLFSLLVALSACAASTSRNAGLIVGPKPERLAFTRVLELLPRDFDTPIVVIDPEAVPDSSAVARLDAFTVQEPDGTLRQKIYLNRDSLVLREAAQGRDFFLKVLAAIIVHEAAHLSGASEADARRAESGFFAGLLARGLVNPEDGERYLAVLRSRPGSVGEQIRQGP